MESREKAELKDRIAKYVIDEGNGEYLLGGLHYRLQEPTKNIESFIGILEEMQAEKSDCFKVLARRTTGKKMAFKVMPTAKEVYVDKSFVAEYDAITEANKKMMAVALRGDNIEELKLENLQLSNRLSKQKIKTHLWPIGISIVSAIIAAWSIYNGSGSVSQEQLGTKIDSIQNRLQNLENSIKQNNTPIVIDSGQTKE